MTGLMIEAALRGLLFAAVVGAGLTALRVRNVPICKAAWTLVLIASLAMPFLMRSPLLAKIPRGWSWVVPIRMHAAAATPAAKPAAVAPVAAITETMRDSAPAPRVLHQARQQAQPEPLDAAPIRIELPDLSAGAAISTPEANAAAAVPEKKVDWPLIERSLLWVYFAVGAALLLRLLIGVGAAMRLWVTAKEVSPLIAPEPGVRASARIASPVTIGLGVVLPADYEQWEPRRLRMVLAHERSHVRQLDFYVQLAAGIYTAVFWFSPLGWWLRRRLAALAEAISDHAGVEAARSHLDYAQVVLEFATLPHRGLPGVAMARSCNLTKRIESLLNERLFHSAFAEGRRRALASLLLVPVALFAATALVRVPSAMAQSNPPNPATAPNPQAAPANPGPNQAAPAQAPPAAAAPATGQAFPGQGPNAGQVTSAAAPQTPDLPRTPVVPPIPAAPQGQGVTAVPPDAQAPPPPPLPDVDIDSGDGMGVGEGQSGSTTTTSNGQGNGYAYHFSSNGDSWAIVDGTSGSMDFSGSWNPALKAQLDQARSMAHGPFLWFTHDGKSYVVDDPAVVARIRAMMEPMRELGDQQRLLGQTQRNLGQEQRELAREQRNALSLSVQTQVNAEMQRAIAELKREQSQWNAQTMAEVQAELKAAQAELSPEKMAAIQKEIQDADAEMTPEKMAQIEAQLKTAQAQLSPERMAEIQKQIKASEDEWNAEGLAEMQARIGEVQARLGEMQRRLSDRQAAAAGRMSELGAQEGSLGEQQGRLGEAQARIAERVHAEVERIIQESLQNGKAKQVP